MIIDRSILINLLVMLICLISIIIGNKQGHTTIYQVRIICVSIMTLCVFNIIFRDICYVDIKEKNDFIQQMVNISGVFVGFIFAGISILFSLIGINKMKSEFSNGFLDKVFHKSFLCLASSLLVLILYFIISINLYNEIGIYRIMIYSFSYSIFYLVWCLIDYFRLIFDSKNSD